MKIKFVCQLQNSGYSGGRYYAIMLATGLSMEHEVHFYTNSPKTQIQRECFEYSNVKFMKYTDHTNEDFYDLSLVFPGGEADFDLHKKLLSVSKFNSKKTILFSFETENWWNSFNIEKKNPKIWLPWKEMSKSVDGILCVSKECVPWARKYYEKPISFPMIGIEGPINTPIADKVLVKKINQICFFTRIGRNSSHKGFKFLDLLNRESLSGFRIKVVFGGSKPSPQIEDRFVKFFKNNNIKLSFENNLNECEKFKILKESKILFYPEEFTGFGLPPLESLYCETRPLCFDIPVVRKNDVGLFRYMTHDSIEEDIENVISNYEFTDLEMRKLSSFKEDINIYKYCKELLSKIMHM